MQKWILLLCLGLMACENHPPDLPQEADGWAIYRHPEAPFTLSYPDYFIREIDNQGLRLRFDGFPSVSVTWCSEEEARDRGLWPKADVQETVMINGVAWKNYLYKHYDGPFFMETRSYVVPVKGKYLAVEFRTDQPLSLIETELLKGVSWTNN